MSHPSIALTYFVAVFFLTDLLMWPLGSMLDLSLYQRSAAGDAVALLWTLVAIYSLKLRQQFSNGLARIRSRSQQKERDESRFVDGPWLKLGVCFAAFYLIMILFALWKMNETV